MGFSQTALAEKLQTSQQNVAHWESTPALPRTESLRKLIEFFGPTSEVAECLSAHMGLTLLPRLGPVHESVAGLGESSGWLDARAMSLKACLQADLAERDMNLSSLASQLGITPQSVSKWVTKDSIPEERLSDILGIIGRDSRTARYLRERAQRLIDGVAQVVIPAPDRNDPEPSSPTSSTSAAVQLVRARLSRHTATRRSLISTLFARLADDPENDEVAAELAELL